LPLPQLAIAASGAIARSAVPDRSGAGVAVPPQAAKEIKEMQQSRRRMDGPSILTPGEYGRGERTFR
jgi:hypothetical protein